MNKETAAKVDMKDLIESLIGSSETNPHIPEPWEERTAKDAKEYRESLRGSEGGADVSLRYAEYGYFLGAYRERLLAEKEIGEIKLALITDERQRIMIDLLRWSERPMLTETDRYFSVAEIQKAVNAEHPQIDNPRMTLGPVSELYEQKLKEVVEHVKWDFCQWLAKEDIINANRIDWLLESYESQPTLKEGGRDE